MLLQFIHMDGFWNDWQDIGLDDDALRQLELAIMEKPAHAPVVSGAGGLRKMRFAPKKWKRGKRGGLRVCYAFFHDLLTVILVAAYSKAQKGDLDADEKKAIKKLLESQKRALRHKRAR